jgi:ribosomal protein L15
LTRYVHIFSRQWEDLESGGGRRGEEIWKRGRKERRSERERTLSADTDSWKKSWIEANANILGLQLWSLVPAEKRDEYLSGNKKDTLPVLDLLPLGYSKVLGKGRIPEVPLVVRARWFSKEAERKITEAGGVVELVA